MDRALADWGRAEGGRLFLRATAICVDGRGGAFLGRSGAGKSALALSLMAYGARLVSDDGVWVEARGRALWLVRPESAPAMIEARGIGLLNAGPVVDEAPLTLAVDLDTPEPERLPPRRNVTWNGVAAPLVLGAERANLAPAILHYLRLGRGA